MKKTIFVIVAYLLIVGVIASFSAYFTMDYLCSRQCKKEGKLYHYSIWEGCKCFKLECINNTCEVVYE